MHQIFRITLDDALPVLEAARPRPRRSASSRPSASCDDGGNVDRPAPAPRRPADRRGDLHREGVHRCRPRAGHAPVQRAARTARPCRATRRSGSATCCRASSPSSSAASRSCTRARSSAPSGVSRRQRRAGQGRRRGGAAGLRRARRRQPAELSMPCGDHTAYAQGPRCCGAPVLLSGRVRAGQAGRSAPPRRRRRPGSEATPTAVRTTTPRSPSRSPSTADAPSATASAR